MKSITNRRLVDLDSADFYPTPAWATYALLDNEFFEGLTHEPACGNGAISDVLLKQANLEVISYDLHDRGYGLAGNDFTLYPHIPWTEKPNNIITNPPFTLAENFVEAGLSVVKSKLALLLRLAFLEGADRQRNIFAQRPPTRVWVFSQRITFYPARHQGSKENGGTTAYAWFVWDKANIGSTELKWFKPGYKA